MTLGPLAPLAAYRQFIVVLLVPLANGKTNKLPLDPRTGVPVDAHNPAVWLDYDTARALATAWGPTFTVGFVLTAADPFWCLDIDGCRTPAGWTPRAQEICASLPGTVIEVSQSGNGLHIWGRGNVPPHSTKNIAEHLELYDSLRFIALGQPGATGVMAETCPHIGPVAALLFPPRSEGGEVPNDGPRADWRGPADDDDLIRRALMSRSAAGAFGGKASFADLWHAETDVLARAYPPDANSREPYDRSSADAALAQHLAFWTGCDIARIERLMRRSKLAREKWDDHASYLVGRTISNACRMQREVLKDKPTQVELTEIPPSAPEARMTAVQGSTFAGRADQERLFAGCVYVLEAHRVLVPGSPVLLKPEQFRARFGGYTFSMDDKNERTSRNAFEAFTESQMLRCPIVEGTCFRPDLPQGAIIVEPGRRRVNTYVPIQVRRVKGDVTPFLEHCRRLLPNERDRQIVLSYMAAVVQHAGIKFQWAPVLQGVEGNGKTLLSRVVAEAVGRRYVHWPKASKLNKQFNGWMVGKIFYAVEDIHTSENVDVIEELKPMITGGDGLEIEAKNVDQVSTEICGNFMFNTNHHAGVKKTRNDRRFCVLYTAQQMEDDLRRDGMDGDYMLRIYAWLRADGYAIVNEFLHTFPIPPEFNPAGACHRAPKTSSTEAAIAASLGRVEQEVQEAIESGRVGFLGGWISSAALDKLLQECGKANQMPPNKRREMLQGLGYDWHPSLVNGRVDNPVAPDGTKVKLFVQKDHPTVGLADRGLVARHYAMAQGVSVR